jgi:hypothetical protein
MICMHVEGPLEKVFFCIKLLLITFFAQISLTHGSSTIVNAYYMLRASVQESEVKIIYSSTGNRCRQKHVSQSQRCVLIQLTKM